MSEKSLLPFNASKLERSVEETICRASEIPVSINDLWNPRTCPVNLLPWLAWSLSVDAWDSEWSESIKRQVIEDSVEVHRTKGTLAAIRRVLSGLNIQSEIEEWFEYDGEPHTFRLTAWTGDQPTEGNIPILDSSLYRNVVRVVDDVKPVRSHYDFRVGVRFNSEFQLANSSLAIIHSRVTATPTLDTTATLTIFIPAVVRVVSLVRIQANTI